MNKTWGLHSASGVLYTIPGHVLSLTSSFFRGLLERRVPRLSRSRDEDVKASAALIAVKPSEIPALQPGALS
ncbi:hypothetical protein SRHO_G00127920 [Serrasalmus rhombeus]